MSAHAAYLESESKRARMMVTPEGIEIPVVIASRSARLGALMLDMMFLIIGLVVVDLLFDLIAGGVTDSIFEDPEEEAVAVYEFLFILGVIFGFFAWYGYFLVQELGPRGATFGKRILGIRVAARHGGRLTPEAVIARNLLRDVEVFYPLVYILIAFVLSMVGMSGGGLLWAALAWFMLFALFPFFNKDALRAGDVIAGTWVVEAPKTKLAEAISTQGAASVERSSGLTGARYEFGEEELSVYGERELQTLERLLRDGNEEALYAVHATICRKIRWDPGEGDERAFLEAFYAQLRARLENDMRFGKRKADKFA
ncbi:MAG: RDD family protein [Pseudomonadota bacterium]